LVEFEKPSPNILIRVPPRDAAIRGAKELTTGTDSRAIEREIGEKSMPPLNETSIDAKRGRFFGEVSAAVLFER